MLLKLVFTAFNGILAPILPDLHGRGEMKQLAFVYKNSTRWMFALTFPIFLVVVLFARQIMGLFGHDFVQGYMVLIILSSAYLLNAATGPVCFMLLMSGKQNLELIDDLSMVAVNILLNIWLIGAYGSVGAAIATGASLVLMNLIKVVQVMVLFKMVALFSFCSKLIVTVPTMIVGAIVIPVAYLFIYRILGLGKEERIALTAITREFTRRREQHQYAAS